MGRRSGLFDDLVAIASRLPWWAGLLLALLSHLLLGALAGGLRSVPLQLGPGGAPSGLASQVLGMFALVFSYVMPIAFVFGAVVSVIGRRKRRGLLTGAQGGGPGAVAAMGWREFEMLVGEAFRQRGYAVTETGGGGADGGVDLLLTRGPARTLVQCKHWKTYRVGVAVVREMLGAMTAQRASEGWVITSGRFTAEAQAFAQAHHIRLVDGDALPALLKPAAAAPRSKPAQAQTQAPATPRPTPAWAAPASAPRPAAPPPPPPPPPLPAHPACPSCAKPMVARVAGQGPRAGQRFWGCPAFPACRGTRPWADADPGPGLRER